MESKASSISIEKEIRNVEASLRMEGLRMSDEARHECRLVLEGKMTHAQYIANFHKRYAKYNKAEV